MSVATMPRKKLVSLEEFLALPDVTGVERMLIDGMLWEEGDSKPHTRFHGQAMAKIAYLLGKWLKFQPMPHGEIAIGEAGFILRHEPPCFVAIDVAVVPPAVANAENEWDLYLGPPTLAVDIHSPYTTVRFRRAKLKAYLKYGVPMVWSIDPEEQTITVYRPGTEPVMFNRTQTISAEPELPGFACPVADFFR